MGMNTKVQGRLPLLQCITFHSLLVFEEIVVQRIYLAKYQKSKTRENSRVHTDYGRHKFNPSGHFYESIQPSTKQKIRVRKQSIEVKADDTIYRRYYVSGKNSQDFGCEGHCQITTQQWIWRFTTELMWVSVINQMKKGMQRHRLIETSEWFDAWVQRNYDFKTKDQKQRLWSKDE